MKKVLAMVLMVSTLFTFAGCGAPEFPEVGIEGLSWGMTKEEVIEVLGEPLSEENTKEMDGYKLEYEGIDFLGYSSEVALYIHNYFGGSPSLHYIFVDIGGYGTEYAGQEEEIGDIIEKKLDKRLIVSEETDTDKEWETDETNVSLRKNFLAGMPVKISISNR